MAITKNQTSNWYHSNSSNTVFVFIHGFFSDSQKCWTSANGKFWPDLVCEDKRLGNPSIFLAGYYTDIDSGNYKVSDCANEVLADLRRPGIDGEPAVLERDNILFICHSLGGIVARYMIERHREHFLNKTVGLVLMASPSYGSDYANKFSKLINFYKNKIAKQLQYANGSLQDLDDRFRSLVQQRTIPRLIGAEAIEHHFIFHWRFLPGFAPVVEKESASRYFGQGKLLANTDHSTCVKPEGPNHVSHKFLTSFYLESFLPIKIPENNNVIDVFLGSTEREPNPLFEIYNLVDEPFYLERQLDIEVNQKIKLFSVWLHGTSGMGKTACTRRNVFMKGSSPIQVYIGALSGVKTDHISLLNEIYYTICGIVNIEFEKLSSAHQLIEKIGDMLIGRRIESGVVLVIDEIPLLDEPNLEIPKFLQSIISLISNIKRKSSNSHASVILNSIFDPTQYIDDSKMKIGEQVKFIYCSEWEPEDILGLAEIIALEINVGMDIEKKAQLINESVGSPRIIKTYFKNFLSHTSNLASPD